MVNVEKLLKMVKNGDFSKFVKTNGEMLKNVGENIKKNILPWSLFTLWILKISFLTQSFTTFFAISNYDLWVLWVSNALRDLSHYHLKVIL